MPDDSSTTFASGVARFTLRDRRAAEACYADVGGTIEEDIPPSRLRLRSETLLRGARRMVVPSRDGPREAAWPAPVEHIIPVAVA